MSDTLPIAYVQAYSDNVIALAQQNQSKLRSAVRVKEGVVGKSAHFERIGATAAVKRTTRLADTPLVNTQHSRRRVSLEDYDWADLIDNNDDVRLLIDPTSEYTQNAAKAMNRTVDDLIIAALGAAAVNVAADDSTSTTAVANTIVHGSVGLTVDKLRQAMRVMDLADVEEDDRYLVASPNGKEDLLQTTEATSQDFNTVRALVNGSLNTFLGFTIIWSTRLPLASTTRTCYAFHRNGIGLAIGKDISNYVEPRYDKNGATQVRFTLVMGATRVEEARVVPIEITE
jgi:capsid protein